MALIETRDLWQQRERRDTLKGVNLRVERGEVLALIGPTGAGKTTLLRLLNLLDEPSRGSVFFDGKNVTASDKLKLPTRRRMAFVLQKPVVFNASVYENVACGLKWRRLNRRQVKEKTGHILDIVSMSEHKDRRARTLSGGEMQRIAIARAIATDPELLLLDEPTANLDPLSAAKIEELITDIIKQNAITVIMATHDMAQGQRLADKIAVLVNGEIVQIGQAREVFYSPKNRIIAEFIGMDNILDGSVISSEAEMVVIDINGTTIEAVADCEIGQKVYACFRPEDITIALSKLSSSARNSLAGTITSIAFNGPFCRIEIDCGFPLIALVTSRSAEEMELEIGTNVFATIKAVSIHIIKRN